MDGSELDLTSWTADIVSAYDRTELIIEGAEMRKVRPYN